MRHYFIEKILTFITSLFLIATLTFFLMKIVPGDPFSEEQTLRSDMQATLEKQYGLNRSWVAQYVDYLWKLLHGNLGTSIKYPERSVHHIIEEGFPISAWLGTQAFFLALIGGVILGSFSAFKSNRWQDFVIFILSTSQMAFPSFILAALLQYILAIAFPIFPLARWGTWNHTILPTLALAATPMAFIIRLTRSSLMEVLQTDYIKLAKAKGLPLSLVFSRHALRHALLPVLSYLGPLFANVLVGSFVVEKIFSIPGLGQWFVNSVANRDYSLIMGLTLFYSFLLLSTVFFVDLLYGVLDPRIRIIPKEI